MLCFFSWVPETKQRTLEELDYVFAVPLRRFMSYQVKVALPWWFKRWVLFQKDAKLAPLYHFDHGIQGGTPSSLSSEDVSVEEEKSTGMTSSADVKPPNA